LLSLALTTTHFREVQIVQHDSYESAADGINGGCIEKALEAADFASNHLLFKALDTKGRTESMHPMECMRISVAAPPQRKAKRQKLEAPAAPDELCGVGIRLSHAQPLSAGFCVVTEIVHGGSFSAFGCAKSDGSVHGVQIGDWLLRVNDRPCQYMQRDDIKKLIIGPRGSSVMLTFATLDGDKPVTVHLRRDGAALELKGYAQAQAQVLDIDGGFGGHQRGIHDTSGFKCSNRATDDEGARRAETRNPHPGKQFCVQLNKQIMSIRHARGICALISAHASHFNAVNVATCFRTILALGRVGAEELVPQALSTLEEAGTRVMGEFGPQKLSNVLHAVAKYKHQCRTCLLAGLERRLEEISHELNPQCISNIVWGYATMDKRVGDKAMGLMEQRLEKISHELTPQHISNIVWSYAKMNKWVGDKAMGLMEQRLEKISHELTPQHISNIVWSYATMDKRVGDQAMGLIEQRLEEIAHELKPQEISNIVWSYAKMNKRVGDKAMGLIEQRLEKISHQLNPQDISNVIWSYATMNKWVGDKAMVLMERRLADISHELTPQHISNIVWSYAKMNKWVGDKVTGLIEQRLEEIAHELKPQEIATLLCSYATMKKKPVEGMMGLMQGRLTQVSQECGPQDISRLLWAYGKMERSPGEQLLGLLEGRAEEICTQFTSLQIAGILWAYGRMETKMGSGLLRSLERQGEATSGVSTPSSAVLSMTMHYYGSTQTSPPPRTLSWIERVTLPSSRHLIRQDVVALLWAYASLKICPGDLMQTLLLTLSCPHDNTEVATVQTSNTRF
jgi:hypothetical protein